MQRPFNIVLSIILCFVATIASSQKTESAKEAWKLLNDNNIEAAVKLFEKDQKNPESLISLTLLGQLDRKGNKKSKYFKKYLKEGVCENAVLYAIRHENSSFGNQGSVEDYQVDLIKMALKSNFLESSLRSSLEYDATHYDSQFDKLDNMIDQRGEIPAIRNWAVIGPFEDLMNSGYDKETGVIKATKESDIVTNENGTQLSWYTPKVYSSDPWIIKQTYNANTSDITYFQTYIKIDQTGEYDFSLGYSGNLKMWVDDQLLHNNSETIISDFDLYNYTTTLKEGYHRVLVQLGSYTANFPCMTIRLYNAKGELLDLDGESTFQPYNKENINPRGKEHYAEKFFLEQVKQNPQSILDKILLAKTYMRSYKVIEAEKYLKQAESIAPNNPLVILGLVDLYNKNNNESETSKYTEKFLKNQPNNVNSKIEELNEHIKNKDYKKAEKILEEVKLLEADEHDDIILTQSIMGLQERYNDLIASAEAGYDKFPNSDYFVNIKSAITEEVMGDKAGSIKVLEKYLKKNYNYTYMNKVANYYFENNNPKKAISILRESSKLMPYDKSCQTAIMNYYFKKNEYQKAIDILDELTATRKYESGLYTDYGDIYFNWGKKDQAIKYYNKALAITPYSYKLKNKIYNLENDENISDISELYDVDAVISDFNEKKISDSSSYDYNIIFHEKSYVILDGGAKALTEHYSVKLNNQASLEYWQRVGFSYNYRFQTMRVEEANVYKPDGSELKGEKYGSEVVFTNLEIGDIIYVKYVIESSAAGRSGKFFSDNFTFNGYVPVYKSRYQLLVEKGVDYTHKIVNGEVEHETITKGNFEQHKWRLNSEIPILRNEGSAPNVMDVATTIHVASSYEWQDIAEWYADLSASQAKMEYSLEQVLNEIFPEGYETISEEEKARKIYDYIVSNIQYSYISFRQSSYTPQKASDVYHTRIGDCKDVSTLYSTLAREVGLKSELVLISTSDNGIKSLSLPSINFNHCIVSVELEGKQKFLELTDAYQSFGSLSYVHHGAPIVRIPTENGAKRTLEYLNPENRVQDAIKRKKAISIDGKDLRISDEVTYTGNPATQARAYFRDINKEERKKNVESTINGKFESGINLLNFNFEYLEDLKDEVIFRNEFVAKKEVIKIGKLNTFKVPFSDVLFSSNSFLEDERTQDFDLNPYENVDIYQEELIINLNSNEKLEELPSDVSINKLGIQYNLSFSSSNTQTLSVKREMKTNRTMIDKADYKTLKSIAEEIIEAENTHIVFKRSK